MSGEIATGDAAPVRIQDAGGVALPDGGRVADRRVFRISGMIVTPEQLDGLRTAGVRAVVDLRGKSEDRSVLIDWAAQNDIRYHHEPIPAASPGGMVQASRTESAEVMEELFIAIYLRIVDHFAPQIVSTFSVIAQGEITGFGCAAGRDRTGIVSAMLQDVLGASDEVMMASYCAAAPDPELLRPQIREWLELGPDAELPPGAEMISQARPQWLRAALERVRETHGGVRGYLVANGLEERAISAIRDFLVLGA